MLYATSGSLPSLGEVDDTFTIRITSLGGLQEYKYKKLNIALHIGW